MLAQAAQPQATPLKSMTTYMLIDENYRDIFSVHGKGVECSCYGRLFGLVVHHKEVFLGVWRLCNVSDAGEQ